MPSWKLELRETRRGCAMLEKTPRFDVILNGQIAGQLHFNMRGYIGYLPTPTGGKLDIGEKGITAFRREVSALNREARAL